jgi:hypothetical protein
MRAEALSTWQVLRAISGCHRLIGGVRRYDAKKTPSYVV